MSSVPLDGDLTMRARIRDAAIALFGERGFERVTVREIAERAGASPGLVLHHFGSKAGLRQSCDEYVTDSLFQDRGAMSEDRTPERVRALMAGVGGYRERLDYLARLVTDSGPAGEQVFDAFLEDTRRTLRDAPEHGAVRSMADPEITALLLTAYGLAPLILQAHLARGLGVDPLSPEGARRMAIPGLELFTRGLYRDDALLMAATAALSHPTGPRSDKGEGDPNQDPDPPAR